MKKTIWIIMIIMCLFGVTACGKTNNNDIASDYAQMKSKSEKNKKATEEVPFEIESRVQYTVTSKSAKSMVVVDANVNSFGMENAAVLETSIQEVDGEYLRNLAERIFDNGVYTIKKPRCICSMDELTADKEYVKGVFKKASLYGDDFGGPGVPNEIVYWMENFNENNVKELKEGQVIVHIAESGEDLQTGEYAELVYDTALISGLIDNVEFELYYCKDDVNTVLILRRVASSSGIESLVKTDSTLYEEVFGENPVDLDAARTIGQNVITRLGYSDYTEFSIGKRKCMDAQYSVFLDGYSIYYASATNQIPDIICDNVKAIQLTDMEKNLKNYAKQKYVCIRVDRDGLMGVDFGSTYEEPQKMSENAVLMGFNKVNEIAKKELANHLSILENPNDSRYHRYITSMGWGIDTIDEIRFAYVPMNYDGKYAFVPAWLYLARYDDYGDKSFFSNQYCLLGVNALDGSIIHFDYNESVFWFENSYQN